MEEADLRFTDDALRSIARKARARETGARGLRSIIENVMLDIMFELPDQPRGNRYLINEEVVEGRQRIFEQPQTKSA
jgi:ATP-dependent Clp protease ATP-binding subunit ClpX